MALVAQFVVSPIMEIDIQQFAACVMQNFGEDIAATEMEVIEFQKDLALKSLVLSIECIWPIRVQFLRELHKNAKQGCVPSNDEEFLEVENLIPENKSESCSPTGQKNILEEDLNLSDDSAADPDYVLLKENFMKHSVINLQNDESNSNTENLPVLQTLTSSNNTKKKSITKRKRRM
ncbi:unnamed protein product [Diabrotica balteata]|uniref:Uncharacterized protein n=1 Tax=Diabrotica balteata TaxID=107213 RepID=A0A9N9T5H1_DIABA|nr:unnamed protein product [Diabrotica balteata]